MKKITSAIMFLLLGFVHSPRADTLGIEPLAQDMANWCWAAVSEMVFTYYNVPALNNTNYQCGIVAGMFPACSVSCQICNLPAPDIAYLASVLKKYPMVAVNITGAPVGRIRSKISYSALTRSQIRDEIDNGRPIVAAVAPSGFSFMNQPRHVALIVGYEDGDGDNGEFALIVNDPFPYDLSMYSHLTNPYIAAGGDLLEPGQYIISYSDFRQKLIWTQSIKDIRCDGIDCP